MDRKKGGKYRPWTTMEDFVQKEMAKGIGEKIYRVVQFFRKIIEIFQRSHFFQ